MAEVHPTQDSKAGRVAFLIVRVLFSAFFVLTSGYCLFAYIPFTYQWVIKCTLVKWLPVFVKLHPALYWLMIVFVALTLVPNLRQSRTRFLSAGFLVFHIAAGVTLTLRPLLPSLGNDDRSYYWSLVSLAPLLWLAAIDFLGVGSKKDWQWPVRDRVTVSAVALAGGFLSVLYAAVSYSRSNSEGNQLRSTELLVALTWSVAAHLVVFTFAFVALNSIKNVARRFASRSRIEFFGCAAFACLLLTLLVRKMILSALTFNTTRADVFSALLAFSVVASTAGLVLRSQSDRRAVDRDVWEPPASNKYRWAIRVVWACLIAMAAFAIPAAVATRDWDFLIQKLGVIAVWTATLLVFHTARQKERRTQHSFPGLLLIAAISVGWYTILGSSSALWPALLRDERLDVDATLARYAGFDVSFKLAREILHPNLNLFPSTSANPNGSEQSVSRDESFYGFLQQNTNLLPSVKVNPVDFNLAGELTRTEGPKPNIFIFVIDSLRQDYVSPYNKAVNFTPNIESFARESLVMRNAFTRYGGTVLAEPSIWSGSLQLHKQYIEPYHPMNSLEKLIETEGYESFLTIDPVVRIITRPSMEAVELDKDYLWFEYDFCRTLNELETRIDERRDGARPMFVYTEPQNVHRVVLKDKGDPVPPGEHYPGFFAPYASQVKYMDSCFGEFIERLKSRGLYDNSIVILTSDHGDSLGEEGRWGHSYWMFPEILRVPLIIHLPPAISKGMISNTSLVSFTTDITPTLYYLLGHKPIEHNPMFGRPLVTSTEKEQTEYLQQNYLLVSSYGPVYCALGGDARALFIADAVNQKDYYFNLAEDPKGTHNRLTDAIRSQNEKLIRDLVTNVNQFYGLGELP